MRFVIESRFKYRENVLGNAIAAIQKLDPSRDWRVEIKPHKEPYSAEQRAALWGLAYRIVAEHTGHSINDIHEFYLGEYFGWVEKEVMGHVSSVPARTTTTNHAGEREELSKLELANYFTFIQAHARTRGIDIPDPDPLWKMRMREEAA